MTVKSSVEVWEIRDIDLRACGTTDRPLHIAALRRQGYGAVRLTADLVVNVDGEITVANVRGEWVAAVKEKNQ